MSTRKRSRVEDAPPPVKRQRLAQDSQDILSALSDELSLRVLGHLSVHQLAVCQRVSKRLYRLAGDSQLWKAAYYATFVRPRVRRLPGRLNTSNRVWLDEQHLVASDTNWQRQYKLRHNWSRGDCTVREVRTADRPTPRSLVQSYESLVVTAERDGLRVWRLDEVPQLQSTHVWSERDVPLAMAMSVKAADLFVVVGMSNGALVAFELSQSGRLLRRVLSCDLPKASALAVSYPFVAMLTEDHLHVYRWEVERPELMLSLRSGGVWPPAALEMRVGANINVSVAYALPQCLAGWSVGLQELVIGRDGVLRKTRTAIAQMFTPSLTRPTALSLSHPYILTAHADNTLSVHMVRTTHASLEVVRGCELWGHTSAVSAVHVGPRGKAVSVGISGEDIRVWDLEGKHGRRQQASVQVRPSAAAPRLVTLDYVLAGGEALSAEARVGFDDERLWVLREVRGGSEALVVYDFT